MGLGLKKSSPQRCFGVIIFLYCQFSRLGIFTTSAQQHSSVLLCTTSHVTDYGDIPDAIEPSAVTEKADLYGGP